jgi:ribosomal protein S18 acetylase RimI-like enzyme
MVMIRKATADDATAIAALHVASWREAYRDILHPEFLAGPIEAERHSAWRERMAAPRPGQQVLVAEECGAMVGFVCAFADDDPVWGTFVDNLHVAAAARGRGLGAALLRAAAGAADRADGPSGIYLWVYEANTPARRFYERLGGSAVETLIEELPGGGSAVAVRMHWPDAAALAISGR